jgi:hypothetical protein
MSKFSKAKYTQYSILTLVGSDAHVCQLAYALYRKLLFTQEIMIYINVTIKHTFENLHLG